MLDPGDRVAADGDLRDGVVHGGDDEGVSERGPDRRAIDALTTAVEVSPSRSAQTTVLPS